VIPDTTLAQTQDAILEVGKTLAMTHELTQDEAAPHQETESF
jgi:hypothetical protein